jgi:alpha-D-xyloside xylohydrolase
MRALVMDFGNDKDVLNIGDEFMFGPAVLVNPVTEYRSRARKVYLPAGATWYDLKSGQLYQGRQAIRADAPYTDIPLFVKAGSILPCGPEIHFADEKPADPIRLFVYTGDDGSFVLYEDENVNYNCEKGFFSAIPLTYSEKEKTLTIGQRKGDFPGMLRTRTFEVVWITPQKPYGLDFGSKPDAVVAYDGSQKLVRMR